MNNLSSEVSLRYSLRKWAWASKPSLFLVGLDTLGQGLTSNFALGFAGSKFTQLRNPVGIQLTIMVAGPSHAGRGAHGEPLNQPGGAKPGLDLWCRCSVLVSPIVRFYFVKSELTDRQTDRQTELGV